MNDDWKNFEPRKNAPGITPKADDTPPIDINDAVALKGLAMGKLVAIIQASSPTPQLVGAIKELMDRVEGKATERVEITGNVAMFDVKGGSDLILEGLREKLAKRKVITIEHSEVRH